MVWDSWMKTYFLVSRRLVFVLSCLFYGRKVKRTLLKVFYKFRNFIIWGSPSWPNQLSRRPNFIPSQWRNRFNAFVWGCGVKRHRFPLMWRPFCYSIFPTLVLLCSCQYFSRADLASLLSQCVILVILVIFRISRVAYFVRLLVSHVLDSGLRPSCLLTSSAFPHFTKSLWSFILLSHESQPRCPLSLSP